MEATLSQFYQKRALTALHEQQHDHVVWTSIELLDSHRKRRKGTVLYHRFEYELVDIAVVQLNDSEECFTSLLLVSRNRVRLMGRIYVVGYTKNVITDESLTIYIAAGKVDCIENGTGSSLFRSYYHYFDGLSESAIFMHLQPNGFQVVGVHAYADDNTSSPHKLKS